MNTQLGSYLKKLRKSHKYTQEYVASYLDVIRQSYSHYETGRTTPGIETLNKLANLYQIPLNELLALQLEHDVCASTSCSPVSGISPRELILLNSFRLLPDQDQQDILDFIQIKAARHTKAR
ncbi:MAG: helix-turn-helix transcriptional regulator [Eubacterium sp.]|jgi:transcriptional regulator with XRE-family HTH domain|nr:helix-turn-helix transcriptional regulator [Eubacterium sp.]